MRKNHWVLWIAVILAVGFAVYLRVALFRSGCANMPANDDECIIALQAKQIAHGHFSLLMLAQPYLFPLEAYLMAPFIEWLPRTAFGARVLAFSMGLLAAVLGWMILRRWGRLSDTWPGILLLLFGSPFLFILQIGLALPGYPSLLLLSALMVWLAQLRDLSPARSQIAAVGVGILGGLACSVTMLALPVLITTGAMIGLQRNWILTKWASLLVVLGTLAGLCPYWLARLLFGGAGNDLFSLHLWHEALGHFLSPTLSDTIPAVLGLGCPVAPGSVDRVASHLVPAPVYGWLWFLSLTGITIKALVDGWIRWRRDKWLSLDFGLVFAGISWLCLIFFLFSSRSMSHTYRYVILIAWAWPFLLAYGYLHSGRLGRMGIGTLTALILAVNLTNTSGLLQRWNHPAFDTQLGSHDLSPVIRYLDSRGIHHAYSTYADSYRLTYATDERITCAQLYNERFPAWPLPYKTDVVDPSTNVAYVLSMDSRFTSEMFERDMASTKVICRIQECGAYKVYTDFVSPSKEEDIELIEFTRAEASHSPDKVKSRINDPTQFWRSEGSFQEVGMWVSVEWPGSRRVGHVMVNHGMCSQDSPDTVHIFYKVQEDWVKLPGGPLACVSMPFVFRNGHPVYGGEISLLEFPSPVETTGLKIEVANPRTHRAWTIYGITLAP
jgi:hypothetical protein